MEGRRRAPLQHVLQRGLEQVFDAPRADVLHRLQAELARLAGGYRGWKVGALNAEQQARIGVERPTAARLLSPFVYTAPARLSHRRFVRPLLECEIAFVIGTRHCPAADC